MVTVNTSLGRGRLWQGKLSGLYKTSLFFIVFQQSIPRSIISEKHFISYCRNKILHVMMCSLYTHVVTGVWTYQVSTINEYLLLCNSTWYFPQSVCMWQLLPRVLNINMRTLSKWKWLLFIAIVA